MATPGLTRQTRHFLIDTNATPHNVIELTEYIGGHETQMSTQPSEITVEQSTTVESYAEGIETRHSARPLYAGANPDAMVALQDNFDTNYLLTVYDNGSFYFGKASIATGADYPTTGFVTQNTDFAQVEPWIAHWRGAWRWQGALTASTASDVFDEPAPAFGENPDVGYVLVLNATGFTADTTLQVYDGTSPLLDGAGATVDAVGLTKLTLKAGGHLATADRFQVSEDIPATADLYLLFGNEVS